jgi:hypothetical protein
MNIHTSPLLEAPYAKPPPSRRYSRRKARDLIADLQATDDRADFEA